MERRQTEGNFAPVSSPGYRVINTHFVEVIKTSQLMLYKEIIAVYSQSHTNTHILCGQKLGFLTLNLVVKVKVTLERARKTQRGSRGINLLFL